MSLISFKVTLPELSTQHAIRLCDELQEVIDEIWRVHGDAMTEVFAREAPFEPEPDGWCYTESDPEDDVPF
ncbi:MAG: hypothetical protein U0166_02820 [Acidobacteriota bacterium]